MIRNECGCFSFTLSIMMLFVQEWAGSGEKIVAITNKAKRPAGEHVTVLFPTS